MKNIILFMLLSVGVNFSVHASCENGTIGASETSDGTLVQTCNETEQKVDVAIDMEYVEGVHYNIVELEADSIQQTPSVLEYVWIGCPSCLDFKPYIKGYVETNGIKNKRIRYVTNSAKRKRDAEISYGLEAIGRSEVVDLLSEYYIKIVKIGSEPVKADFINFFKNQGISNDELNDAMKSRAVVNRIKSTTKEMRRIQVSLVPTVIVNNKYKANWQNGIETEEQYIHLLNYLLTK